MEIESKNFAISFFFLLISEQKSIKEIRRELESLGKKRIEIRNNRYECTICPKVFNCRMDLRRHLLMHQDLRNFVCSICNARANSQFHLRCHVRRVHEKKANFPCMLCSIRFSTMQELDAHKSSVHQSQTEPRSSDRNAADDK